MCNQHGSSFAVHKGHCIENGAANSDTAKVSRHQTADLFAYRSQDKGTVDGRVVMLRPNSIEYWTNVVTTCDNVKWNRWVIASIPVQRLSSARRVKPEDRLCSLKSKALHLVHLPPGTWLQAKHSSTCQRHRKSLARCWRGISLTVDRAD